MSGFSQGDLSSVLKGAGAKLGKAVKKQSKKLVKRALLKVGKILLLIFKKLMIKLLLVIGSFIGTTGIISFFAIILVGGALIMLSATFGFLSDDSPVTAQELQERYTAAVVETAKEELYRPLNIVIQAIDNVRITINELEFDEVEPKKIAKMLVPDITYKVFEDTTITTTTTTKIVSKNGGAQSETSSDTRTETNRKEVVTWAHTWNKIYEYNYHLVTSTESYSAGGGDGSSTSITIEKREWVSDPPKITLDFTKFDDCMEFFDFSEGDRDLVANIIASDEKGLIEIQGYIDSGPLGDDTIEESPWAPSTDGEFIWPTSVTRITSRYGYRIDPITKNRTKLHKGIDISDAKCKTSGCSIFAVGDGKVLKSSNTNNGYGNEVQIIHSNGLISQYAHMSTGSLKFKKGDLVKQGQVIGTMGTTGNSTGIHLHFEVRSGSKVFDPLLYLKGAR